MREPKTKVKNKIIKIKFLLKVFVVTKIKIFANINKAKGILFPEKYKLAKTKENTEHNNIIKKIFFLNLKKIGKRYNIKKENLCIKLPAIASS